MGTTTKAARRSRSFVVAGAVALLVLVGSTACEPARLPQKDRTIIFVHGYSAFGNGVNCNSAFGSLKTSLRANGFTGDFVTIGFYDSDSNCDVNLRSWNSSISNSSSWQLIAKAMSSYVYTTYTANGKTVDLVGHSMGGLIIRGAVKGSTHHESGFSQPIKVEDALTLAAPHNGAAWYSAGCLWGQCSSLKPGADEIDWLNTDGNPQGPGGTEWTVVGSSDDAVVPSASAMYMFLPDNRRIVYSGLGHSDYQSNATVQTRAAKALAEPDS